MAQTVKVRRLTNPARRRLTAKQLRYFGTKSQRAAAGVSRIQPKRHRRRTARTNNPSVRRTKKRAIPATLKKMMHKQNQLFAGYVGGRRSRSRRTHSYKRIGNVGKIITLTLPNPGKRTKSSKRRVSMARRRTVRRVRMVHNPFVRRIGRVRRRRTTRNVARRHHRRYHRRRNPGFSLAGGGAVNTVLGIIGGAAVTKLALGFLPSSLTTGIPGYISTAVVATLQGQLVGKVFKNPVLGRNMMYGGYVLLGLKLLSDFVPGFSAYLPFNLGLIGQSSFYVPQVPQNGSIASGLWATPSGVVAAMPVSTGMHGLGARMAQRRGGRTQ